jgi:hypothetical protein
MKLRPIETAPKGRYILLFGRSGYTTTPLRCEVGCWSHDKKRWNNHAGDAFTDGGDEPTHWCPLPDLPEAECPSETTEMLKFLLAQMQVCSPKMDGQHVWRFGNSWPMSHCVGPTPESAVQAAIAEVKRSQAEESDPVSAGNVPTMHH